MRKFLICLAMASTGLTAPAIARDNSFYAGLEAGGMIVEDSAFGYTDNTTPTIGRAYILSHKPGWDADLIAGYDLGMVRVEGELGYKRASVDQAEVSNFITLGGFGAHYDADGHSTAISLMLNGLVDFGDEDSWSGYVGPGIGFARVKTRFGIDSLNRSFSGDTGRIAWQVVAGVRKAITPNLDLGVKYRFFNVPNLKYDAEGPAGPFTLDGRWRSHSLLLSLIYNFAAPVVVVAPLPPPPPPPPPPATQTCPDGTVILATEMCPAPPPPPPPPPPAPERG